MNSSAPILLRMVLSILVAAFFATLVSESQAQCCDEMAASPHFFSSPCPPANNCDGPKPCLRCRVKLGWRLSGLQSELASGNMPIHTPYQTWQLYYYFRPYQGRQSDYNSGFESTIREALGIIYEQRLSRIRQTVAEVDPLAVSYTHLTLPTKA